jgi:two-component system, OmpR family, phosphate regulon sensor histidine kinase PhoR
MASASASAGATGAGKTSSRLIPGRRVGMRVWLGAAFAGVTLITAFAVYIFVDDSSGRTLQSESGDLAVGRTTSVADQVADAGKGEAARILDEANTETFQVWAINRRGGPFAPLAVPPADLRTIEQAGQAGETGRAGRRFRADLAGDRTLASAPIFGSSGEVRGAVVGVAEPPPALTRAFDDLQGDRVRAIMIAIVVGVLVGFVVSTLIAIRVKRLARSAEQMAAGKFDAPLPAGGSDEIGDLTRSLDTMREALRDSFDLLATERDRLSAILDGLREGVIVVGEDGEVRFSNPAGEKLVRHGQPASALIPALRAAADRGSEDIPALGIGERTYRVQARKVPAEHAVLLVVSDRTEELKREQAEREFVSNAAHELRNPLAGISSGIEVLRGGAKDDPDARERFLSRLADDADRMTRLTQSLLTLARVEAAGQRGEAEVVDVTVAAEEAAQAVEPTEGVEIRTQIDEELVASGDPVLLRQVLIGLLTNACKNTPAPGAVTLRASREEGGTVTIEVEDTGKGIPAAEQGRVFERFYRGSGALESEGFGLGLSIAKRMVDVMGGEIGLRSADGAGSTFWVRLRQAKTSTPVA